MNLALPTCAALLLVAPLLTQAPAAPTRLHIPAGQWSVRDLLTHAEQALRTPIAADATELALASAEPVGLQFDLTLDPERGYEALAALLSTRGLLLSKDDKGNTEVRATPRGNPDWVSERAVPTTLADLLDHPHRHSTVRVTLQTTSKPDMLINMLRMAAATGSATPTCEQAENGIVCTGTAAAALLAVTQLAVFDPLFASSLPQRTPISIVSTAKGGPVELTAGEHGVPELVALLAKNQGINIVMSPAVAKLTNPVPVAKAEALDFATGANRLTTLLWQHHVLFLELDVRHGLYEVVLVDNPRQAPGVVRASQRTVEAALAAADCAMYISVPFTAKNLDAGQLMEHVRTAMRAADPRAVSLISIWSTENGVWITGLSPQVAGLLRKLQAADLAQARR